MDETFEVNFYYWLRVDSINLNKNYEFIKNEVFGFIVLFIEININDSFVNFIV